MVNTLKNVMAIYFDGGNGDLADLLVRPLDIARDMIADTEACGYEVAYEIECDTPSRAVVAYDCALTQRYEPGPPLGCSHGLVFRAMSPPTVVHQNSARALLALTTNEIGAIYVDLPNLKRGITLNPNRLVAEDCVGSDNIFRVIVNHEKNVNGNVVRLVDTDELFFHPYNSATLLRIPPFFTKIRPGTEYSPDVRTVTIQNGDFMVWASQELDIPLEMLLSMHDTESCAEMA